MNRWVNFLSLIPGTILTILIISIAFLRFYDETDFTFLGQLANPRVWSNRLTVAAILVALVNFGIEWDRRNRETDRLAEEAQRRTEEEQRRTEEEQRRREDRTRAENERAEAEHRRAEAKEQATRRARVEIERDLAFLSFLADPSEQNQQRLTQVLELLNEYRDTLA
jgi:flagellar biosynthesis/type III secretory pathway M-ring protein FliF/YscJ